MANWHVGMQVVCGDQADPASRVEEWQKRGIYPVKGIVYTIRNIVFKSSDGAPLLLLEEIINPPPPGYELEPGFHARHFRPVRKTSIDCFLAILSKTPTELDPEQNPDRTGT